METRPELERIKFISDLQSGLYEMTELCVRYSISRKTGYKWKRAARLKGEAGLVDRSRAPLTCPHKMSSETERRLLDFRRGHPKWGPKKILEVLWRRHQDYPWPAKSSVGDLFRRKGLTTSRRRRRKHPHPGSAPVVPKAPNDVWTIDFKGHFRMRNGVYCYPLKVVDQHTRRILVCKALPSTEGVGVRAALEEAFRSYGLPRAFRSDNGSPFASQAIHGLSVLNAWWMKLGIAHQRIRPSSPQENGAHERMHRTLKNETCCPPSRNFASQQIAFDRFCHQFNDERPHEALKGDTPNSRYRPSKRIYKEELADPKYPKHFDLKRVTTNGGFRLRSALIFLSMALVGELVGLEEISDKVWAIYFGRFLIARIDERDNIVRP